MLDLLLIDSGRGKLVIGIVILAIVSFLAVFTIVDIVVSRIRQSKFTVSKFRRTISGNGIPMIYPKIGVSLTNNIVSSVNATLTRLLTEYDIGRVSIETLREPFKVEVGNYTIRNLCTDLGIESINVINITPKEIIPLLISDLFKSQLGKILNERCNVRPCEIVDVEALASLHNTRTEYVFDDVFKSRIGSDGQFIDVMLMIILQVQYKPKKKWSTSLLHLKEMFGIDTNKMNIIDRCVTYKNLIFNIPNLEGCINFNKVKAIYTLNKIEVDYRKSHKTHETRIDDEYGVGSYVESTFRIPIITRFSIARLLSIIVNTDPEEYPNKPKYYDHKIDDLMSLFIKCEQLTETIKKLVIEKCNLDVELCRPQITFDNFEVFLELTFSETTASVPVES